MAGLARSQQHHHHRALGHHSHPGTAAVGEHQGGATQQQGRGRKGLAGQPLPAQQRHQGQRDGGQQEASEQVGVVEGAVDADRAVCHGVGIGPAGQLAGIAKQLADAHHARHQRSGQQGGHHPVPPDRSCGQQLTHQGIHAQVAEQFQQTVQGG